MGVADILALTEAEGVRDADAEGVRLAEADKLAEGDDDIDVDIDAEGLAEGVPDGENGEGGGHG